MTTTTKPKTAAEIRARVREIGEKLRGGNIELPVFHELVAERDALTAEYRRLEAVGKP